MRRLLTLIPLVCGVLPALAAPPVAPAELTAPVGKPTLLTVTVEAGKKLGTEKTYDPAKLMLARLWTDDPATYEFWVFPNEAGVYYVPLWTEGETKGTVVKVVAGGGKPADPPPVIDPPKDPPAQPEVRYYFAVVRPDQNTTEFERLMNLPAWDEWRQKGHVVNDIPVSELPRGLTRPATLPAVMILKKASDGNWTDTGRNKPMPTTDAQIRELLK